ncbi:hypothetical protein DM02DRAFT_711304 [Periconia macrospinosa]|uniref:C3H1-type domain-containing protein n=1 Tax=Periconia macrospinosa TaxID=97972 RepID=A0A2V1DNX1_9PLEO|nr:hypothetical protein DM02DRAFT_711304 [Periconia macrospinosa]
MAISPTMISVEEQSVRYYILRKPSNTMVPLIPVDQLPFQIQGVPPSLTHRQMSDERWEFVDETEEPATVLPLASTKSPNGYHATRPSSAPKSGFRAPDHDVRCGIHETPSRRPVSTSQPSSGAHATVAPQTAPLVSPHSLSNSLAKSLSDTFAELYPRDAQRFGYRPTRSAPSGITPDPSKKVYCTHWIATGECKFIAQGCIFKHEMPSTQEELRKIGFTQVPKWYKEKQAFDRQGPTWMQRQQQKQKQKEEEKEAEAEADASASPADLGEAKLKSFADTIRRTRTTRSPTQDVEPLRIDPPKLSTAATHNRKEADESFLIDLIDLDGTDEPLFSTSSQSIASQDSEEETPITTKDHARESIQRRDSEASSSFMISCTHDSDNFGDDDDDADEKEGPPSRTAKAKRQMMTRKVYPSKTSLTNCNKRSLKIDTAAKITTAGVRTPPPPPPPPAASEAAAAPPPTARQPITTTAPKLTLGKVPRIGGGKLVKAQHVAPGLMSSRYAPPYHVKGRAGAISGQGGQGGGKGNVKGKKKLGGESKQTVPSVAV